MDEKQRMKKEFQKQLLQSQVEVQEATFSTLSKELHDNVGQLLSTTRMILGMVERSMAVVPDGIHTAQATLVQAIQELRALSKTLSKEWLEQFSFIDNVKTAVNRINASGALQVTFNYSTRPLPFSSEEQIILFRIVQESIQNAIKHARATTICIELVQNGAVTVMIQDNGVGFDATASFAGMGLLNMKHRVQLLGGTIVWNSDSRIGTSVIISLPSKLHE